MNPRRHFFTKRALLTQALSLISCPSCVDASTGPRVVTIDWTLTEIVLQLGIAPIATAEVGPYGQWVSEPRLPRGIVDLGLRSEPNLELLIKLKPDAIFTVPQFSSVSDILRRIATTHVVPMYAVGLDPLIEAYKITDDLGKKLDRGRAANKLLLNSDEIFATLQQGLTRSTASKHLVFQFIDDMHVRVFGTNSLFGSTLVRIGLQNAWGISSNSYGFDMVPVTRFLELRNTYLWWVGPSPYGIEARLARSPIWTAVDRRMRGRIHSLPSIWPFGGVSSATRFATSIANNLQWQK